MCVCVCVRECQQHFPGGSIDVHGVSRRFGEKININGESGNDGHNCGNPVKIPASPEDSLLMCHAECNRLRNLECDCLHPLEVNRSVERS